MILSNRLKTVSMKDIKIYEKNVKVHSPEQIQLIKKSIETNSYVQPICIWKKNEIVIGTGRYLALKEMNVKEIEVVDVSDLSIKQIKKLRIADNQIANRGEWDKDNLRFELKSIYNDIDSGFEDMIDTLGFDESFADEIIASDRPGPDTKGKPEAKGGTVKHHYICKECKSELICPKGCNNEHKE